MEIVQIAILVPLQMLKMTHVWRMMTSSFVFLLHVIGTHSILKAPYAQIVQNVKNQTLPEQSASKIYTIPPVWEQLLLQHIQQLQEQL